MYSTGEELVQKCLLQNFQEAKKERVHESYCQEYTPFSLFTPVSYTCCLHPVTTPLPPYIPPFTSCHQTTPFTYRFLMVTLFSINTLLVVVGR